MFASKHLFMRPLPNLDFMRSIAVILVVVDHTMLALGRHSLGKWDPAWLGTLGVFIFFVHTALVLMWSLERKPHTLDFYIRRLFRIYPLAVFAILVALFTHAPLQGPVTNFFEYHPLARADTIANLLLVQNFMPHPSQIVDVTWSLPLEVQMYVVLPVLFFFARSQRFVWPLLLLWILVAAFSLQKFVDPNDLNLLTVVPMFLPGVMAYIGFSRLKPRLPAWTFPFLLAAVICFGMYRPTNRKGWLVDLALGLALPFFHQFRAAWLVWAADRVAKYSYGIYLAHPFALVLGIYLLPGKPLALQLTVEILSLAFIAWASYHLIEAPMIQLGKRLAARVEKRAEQAELVS